MKTGASHGEQQENLLPRVARGDEGAVRECLSRYGGLVWSLARRLATTEADAEDAVQEIFLDVWKSAERFDASVASEVTFIAMIARRRLIDRRRKEGRRPDMATLPDGIDADPIEVGASTETNEDVKRAQRAMGQLSTEQQRVLQLSIFHGLSHERISRATDLPLGTVKTHARRGLIRLREIIEAEERASNQNGPTSEDGGVTR
ncbi:MAG: sigma-70 family RNA polymerase sigma factor [Planctomycetota bacterium]